MAPLVMTADLGDLRAAAMAICRPLQ